MEYRMIDELGWICLWCYQVGSGVLPFHHWKGDCAVLMADVAAACDEARAATQRAFEPGTVTLEEVRRLNAIAAAWACPPTKSNPTHASL